jgi:3-hydroxyisobutyrate dehydrogenase
MAIKVSFIGLGRMGHHMAKHLILNNYDVKVYNRTLEKSKAWSKQFQGSFAHTPEDVVKEADFIISCVGNDQDLKEVCLGDFGCFKSIKDNAIFIDHTTTSSNLAQELYQEARKQNFYFLDAPVSGGESGAIEGKLTIMVGGDKKVYDKSTPLMDSYAIKTKYLGPSGSGQKAKMVNQICITGIIQSLSEGLHFAKKVGLKPHEVVDVISEGAASSWQMINRHQSMLTDYYEHGFAVKWMRKDLHYALEEAKVKKISLPIAKIIDQYYAEIEGMGGKNWDTSSLLKRLENTNSDEK